MWRRWVKLQGENLPSFIVLNKILWKNSSSWPDTLQYKLDNVRKQSQVFPEVVLALTSVHVTGIARNISRANVITSKLWKEKEKVFEQHLIKIIIVCRRPTVAAPQQILS